MALGARPLRVIGLVISDVGAMAVLGLVAGAAGAFASARFVTRFAVYVSPSDSWAIAVPLACLVLVCALAALCLRCAQITRRSDECAAVRMTESFGSVVNPLTDISPCLGPISWAGCGYCSRSSCGDLAQTAAGAARQS